MTNPEVAILMLTLFIVLVLLGFPIAFTLIAMGDHDDKLRYIQEHNLEYFIDDRAETCNFLAASGIRPLVYSHPWNRDRHNLPTVENWGDIRRIVEL